MIYKIPATSILPSLLLSLTGGLLLYGSWFPDGRAALVFVAFVPFFLLAMQRILCCFQLLAVLFSGFFLFHFLSGFWMYSSTIPGSLMAHLFNASYFSMLFWIWRYTDEKLDMPFGGGFVLVFFWLGFELLHQHWELAWPWFTLGHVFAETPHWVQWYAYTGVGGGTAWVLLVNAQFTDSLLTLRKNQRRQAFTKAGVAIMLVLTPIVISKLTSHNTHQNETTIDVAIVQPNIHPQKEKFGGLTPLQQLDKALELAAGTITPETQLLVFPETMLVQEIDENAMGEDTLIANIKAMISEYPILSVLSGAFTKRFQDWHPSDAAKAIGDSLQYVVYNSALLIDQQQIHIYHKNRLVPLVEKQPFLNFMKSIRQYIEKSGGFFGSYGTFNETRILPLQNGLSIKPIICFESAFSTYTAKGETGHMIVLITNDGWWKGKGGYSQHLQLARLRAIENRQWVVRAANTGVSAIISPNGVITQYADYGEAAVLIAKVPVSGQSSFYVRYPWLGNILLMLPGLMVVCLGIFTTGSAKKHSPD